MEIWIKTLEAISSAAAQLLQYADNRHKMAFYGEIGVGKTTLIQAICRQLGVQEPAVSPTFSLVNEYSYLDGAGSTQLVYHLDLYRLQNLQEALDIGIEDFLENKYHCFIEWPQIIEPLLPENTLRITMESIDHSTRRLTFL